MDAWHTFYATAGGASAALIGLLFVGVLIHLDTVVSRRDVRSTARGAFQWLLAILVVSLVALVPHIGPQDLGWTLVGIAAAALLQVGFQTRGIFGADLLLGGAKAVRKVCFRFGVALLLLLVGILFLTGQPSATLWLMAAVLVLLGLAALNSWDLLIDVAEAKRAARGTEEARNEGDLPQLGAQ